MPDPRHGDVPAFSPERLLIIGTGALVATHLPWWLSWLREAYPQLQLKAVLTGSAQRFVTVSAVSAFASDGVHIDAWSSDPAAEALHVEFSEWAQAALVFPCSMHYLARFALGLCDTPSLLALQCTDALVGLAPALPPGGIDSASYARHVAMLTDRENVVVAPPREGRSARTGKIGTGAAAGLPDLLRAVERRGRDLQAFP